MPRPKQFRTLDVPQADSLPLIRRVVEAIHVGLKTVSSISEDTGFSERHVRYRLQAARILGFLSDEISLTAQGKRLVITNRGGSQEHRTFCDAVRSCDIARLLAPGLLDEAEINSPAVAKRMERLFGLSPATAERRTRVMRSWRRQLVGATFETKDQ